jgi:hypothetical protein
LDRVYHEDEYRDFIPVQFFKNRTIVTVLPSFSRIDGKAVKTGESPENPLLIIERENESGNIIDKQEIALGEAAEIGEHSMSFIGLRRWSSFRVVGDPGYDLVWLSLWIGVLAVLLRYLPDIRIWFSDPHKGSQSQEGG